MSKNGKKRVLTFEDRACEGCGTTFTPTNGRQRYHSVECRREHAGEAGRAMAARGGEEFLTVLRRGCDRELAAAEEKREELERQRAAAHAKVEADFERKLKPVDSHRTQVEIVLKALV